jgi:hypothetical protein
MAAGLDASFRNCASLLYARCGVLSQCKSTCSAVFLPFLHKHSSDSTLGTLTEARNRRRPILPVLAWKSAELSAFLSWLYSLRQLWEGWSSAAMLSGQLALRPRSSCHLFLHSVSTAFLLWQPYPCSRCLAQIIII